jgi:regulator of RNase E activity RraA
MVISADILVQLRKIDTPTVCNLTELFDVRPRNLGYMDGRIVAAFPEMPPMVGFAATAGFRSAAPPRKGDAYGSTADQVERFGELSGPAVVVFQDMDNPPAAATFGEVMCTTYKAFGAAGLITSGAGRDLQQVRAIDFPVFTDGTICAHGYTHILNMMTPVHVGGIVVYPDDLLHGDCNGVTTIPHDIARELVDIADDFIAAEAIVISAMRESNPTPKRLRAAVAEMRSRADTLRARVSRHKM